MSYETQYADSGKGLLKIGRGIVTGTELLQTGIQQAQEEERNRQLKYALVDFSETTDLRVTTENVRQLVEINRKTAQFSPGIFVAIVAPGAVAYGMSRWWQTFSADLGWTANVFHSRPAAMAWLLKQLGGDEDPEAVLAEYPSLRVEDQGREWDL